jgi:hypothetical protein
MRIRNPAFSIRNGISSPGKEVLVEEGANIFVLGVYQAVQVVSLRLHRHLEVGGQHGPALGQNLNQKLVVRSFKRTVSRDGFGFG